MTKLLAGFLKPGGKLIVSDFRADGGEYMKDKGHIIAHPGMAEGVMREVFAGAGLTNIVVEDAFDYTLHERALHIFFTVGTKV